ncbi:aspartic peptidase domain-containing protein [Xylogone sp. PMI_703]|nr:aspartic peptidase domain-containing protein [Xylogone sp. PMI_703]
MLSSVVSTTLFLSAARALAVRSSHPADTCYHITEHVIPLYPPKIPALHNFEADIQVGSQTVRAVMDTGSSNIWFMGSGVKCVNPDPSQPGCGYPGPRIAPNASFQQNPGTHANISYGSGEYINAINGYGNVSLGGINVSRQELNLATGAFVGYSGEASGLVGLAYPHLTTVYPDCNQQNYSPLLTTMFRDGLVEPVFATALSRSKTTGGVITLGGIPDIDDPQINATQNSAVTVPNEILDGTRHHTYYLITVDGFCYSGAAANAGKGQYVVDTGTIPNSFPEDQARAFNALFQPPAIWNDKLGIYVVQCNATAPDLAVEIGGKLFYHNPKDLIVSACQDSLGCMSGVQAGTTVPGFPPILGSVFLRSVLTIFDVGKDQITFLPRVYYKE